MTTNGGIIINIKNQPNGNGIILDKIIQFGVNNPRYLLHYTGQQQGQQWVDNNGDYLSANNITSINETEKIITYVNGEKFKYYTYGTNKNDIQLIDENYNITSFPGTFYVRSKLSGPISTTADVSGTIVNGSIDTAWYWVDCTTTDGIKTATKKYIEPLWGGTKINNYWFDSNNALYDNFKFTKNNGDFSMKNICPGTKFANGTSTFQTKILEDTTIMVLSLPGYDIAGSFNISFFKQLEKEFDKETQNKPTTKWWKKLGFDNYIDNEKLSNTKFFTLSYANQEWVLNTYEYNNTNKNIDLIDGPIYLGIGTGTVGDGCPTGLKCAGGVTIGTVPAQVEYALSADWFKKRCVISWDLSNPSGFKTSKQLTGTVIQKAIGGGDDCGTVYNNSKINYNDGNTIKTLTVTNLSENFQIENFQDEQVTATIKQPSPKCFMIILYICLGLIVLFFILKNFRKMFKKK